MPRPTRTKTMRLPSGDQAGYVAAVLPVVSSFRPVPSVLMRCSSAGTFCNGAAEKMIQRVAEEAPDDACAAATPTQRRAPRIARFTRPTPICPVNFPALEGDELRHTPGLRDTGADEQLIPRDRRAGVDPGPELLAPEDAPVARGEAVDRAVERRREDDVVRNRRTAEARRREATRPQPLPGRRVERDEQTPALRRVDSVERRSRDRAFAHAEIDDGDEDASVRVGHRRLDAAEEPGADVDLVSGQRTGVVRMQADRGLPEPLMRLAVPRDDDASLPRSDHVRAGEDR